ncbi:MAG: hypothetical protein ABR551_00555 [Gemmatimonadales bacterium]
MKWISQGLTALVAAMLLVTLAPGEAEGQRKERDRITREELEQFHENRSDLFRAIRSLRPHFVQGSRGSRSIGGGAMVATRPILYVNGTRMADVAMLTDIMTRDVVEVRFIPPTEAAMTYNAEHGAGVIQVTLINKPPDGG